MYSLHKMYLKWYTKSEKIGLVKGELFMQKENDFRQTVWVNKKNFLKPEKGTLRNICGSRANILLENGVVCSADVTELFLSEEEVRS